MEIVVTVGMAIYPFDRLLEAVSPLCSSHSVFVQSGSSSLRLPCPSAPYLSTSELLARIDRAQLVITHAGNTVRLVQRRGKVPIAMARLASHGEMPNDHQLRFLQHEAQFGRVIPLWAPADLPALVSNHSVLQAQLISSRPLPEPASPESIATALNRLCEKWIP